MENSFWRVHMRNGDVIEVDPSADSFKIGTNGELCFTKEGRFIDRFLRRDAFTPVTVAGGVWEYVDIEYYNTEDYDEDYDGVIYLKEKQ